MGSTVESEKRSPDLPLSRTPCHDNGNQCSFAGKTETSRSYESVCLPFVFIVLCFVFVSLLLVVVLFELSFFSLWSEYECTFTQGRLSAVSFFENVGVPGS